MKRSKPAHSVDTVFGRLYFAAIIAVEPWEFHAFASVSQRRYWLEQHPRVAVPCLSVPQAILDHALFIDHTLGPDDWQNDLGMAELCAA